MTAIAFATTMGTGIFIRRLGVEHRKKSAVEAIGMLYARIRLKKALTLCRVCSRQTTLLFVTQFN